MFKLRTYQDKFINDITNFLAEDSVKSVCAALATGAGKTVIAAALIDFYLQNNLRILFCVNREELVLQSKEKFKSFQDKVSIIKAGKEYKEMFNAFLPVQIVMQQTWFARRKKLPALNPDLIIVDEVHEGHSSQRLTTLRETYPQAKYLGISATPIDEKGYLLSGFDKHIMGLQVPDLQKLGYLCDDICFAPVDVDLSGVRITAGDYNEQDLSEAINKDFIVDNVLYHYKKRAQDRKTLGFCVDIKHAERMHEVFSGAGYRSRVLHSQLENPEDRHIIFQEMRDGKIDIIFNVGICTTGLDLPMVDCILTIRPTKSLRLALQIWGRGLRIYPGKENCLFLDCANWIKKENFETPGSYRFFLKKGESEKKKDDKDKKILCPECECINSITASRCKECGHKFPVKACVKFCPECECCNQSSAQFCKKCGHPFESKKELESLIVDMKEYTKKTYSREKILTQLQAYVPSFGYKEGMAKHLLREIEEDKPDDWPYELFYKFVAGFIKKAKAKNYKPFWIKSRIKDYFNPEELTENSQQKVNAITEMEVF